MAPPLSDMAPPRPKVLICDDDALSRRLILDSLESELDCLAVVGGEGALARASEAPPDLVISDLMMPGMSGLELCRRLRAIPNLAGVPVVLLTAAQADDELRAAVFEAGADDYLTKPIGPKELVARARTLVKVRLGRQQLEQRTAELEAANATLRAAQGTLVQTEKLATLGTLVAGIAHEINNPLSFMKSGSAQLHDLASEGEEHLARLDPRAKGGFEAAVAGTREVLGEIRGVAKEIAEGANRLARIAADLKAFSSAAPNRMEPVDLAAEVKRAWFLSSLQAVHKPRLVVDEGVWPTVVAQSHHIGQVLVNLFVNAVHALEPKGEAGEVKVWVTDDVDQVSLHVVDNGPGISEEHLPRIFDPFFTTKPPGKGTGLGLSVSFGLIRGMGGLIEATSAPGEGAHFIIHLPKEALTDDYNATRMGRPPSRSILQFVPRPPSGANRGRP